MTADIGDNSNAELKRRAERRIGILDKIADLQEELKAHKQQDKEDGFNEKALGQVIKELRKGVDYQADQLQLEMELNTYRRAVDLPTNLADAQKLAVNEASEVQPPRREERKRKRDGKDNVVSLRDKDKLN